MLTAFLIVLLFLILLLVIPLGAEILYEEGKHRFRFLYAGIRFPIDTSGTVKKKKAPKEKEPHDFPETIEQFQAVQETFFRLWELYGGNLFSRFFNVLKRVIHILHFRVHEFNLSIATADPALTGILYGAACSAATTLPRNIPLVLTSDFINKESILHYRLSMTIFPVQVFTELIRTAIYLRLWSVWRLKREIWSPIQARRQHV